LILLKKFEIADTWR